VYFLKNFGNNRNDLNQALNYHFYSFRIDLKPLKNTILELETGVNNSDIGKAYVEIQKFRKFYE
jgi:hypothetical protein